MLSQNLSQLSNEGLLKTEKQTKTITYLLLGLQIVLLGIGIYSMFIDEKNAAIIAVGCSLGVIVITNSEKLKKIKVEKSKRGI